MTPLPERALHDTQQDDLPSPDLPMAEIVRPPGTGFGPTGIDRAPWRRVLQIAGRVLRFASPVLNEDEASAIPATAAGDRDPSGLRKSNNDQGGAGADAHPLELVDPIGFGMDGVFRAIADAKGYVYRDTETCWTLSSERPSMADIDRLRVHNPKAYNKLVAARRAQQSRGA